MAGEVGEDGSCSSCLLPCFRPEPSRTEAACSANNASRVPEQRVLMCGSEVSRYLTAHGSN